MPPKILDFYKLTAKDLFARLNTNQTGLSEIEAQQRFQKFGPNKIISKNKVSAISIFIEQFKNTLIAILIASAFLILFIYYFGEKDPSDLIESALILIIVLMITSLGFIQEYKAEKAVESLKKLLAYKTKVIRENHEKEVDATSLVPGDVVILEEGNKVPADIRLLQAFNLQTVESSLTGESQPITKFANEIKEDKQIADQKNMVFSGTVISSGRGIGLVVSTGGQTEIGKIATLVSDQKDDPTPIQKRLDQIGKNLGYMILGICFIVFIFIVFFASEYTNQPLLQRVLHSFIAAVALAVAAIPEGLPAVVTISLALGTQRMLKKNALIRKLNSIETLGSTDTICSDKTGTLTKGEMTVQQIFFAGKTYRVSGVGYEKAGEFFGENKKIDPSFLHLLLLSGLVCNNALLDQKGQILGDPTEAALLVSAEKAGIKHNYQRLLENPFSLERKMMSVVVSDNNQYFVFAKGAPEVLIKKCQSIQNDKQVAALTPQNSQTVLNTTYQMSQKALRTLGFAYKEVTGKEYAELKENPLDFEKNLTFLGLQGMIDPPRTEVKQLIAKCQESGIRVIMITGDHIETAKAVAKEIGIESEALGGDDLAKLDDQKLHTVLETVNIFARINPGFKMKIVDILKKDGHIVAMTGDGVNDAPALKKADIGIAMGITGTDVSKEASDMVLLDDQFSTIVSAIEEGRGIFQNIRKFVNYLLACNIAEVLIVFIAVLLFQELPLTATMLLWINVVTDGLPAIGLGLDPAEKNIMRLNPKSFQSEIITKRLWLNMIIFGLLMTIATLGIYLLNLKEGLSEAKGAAFIAVVIYELLKLYVIRSNYNIPLFSNRWLHTTVIITLILQLLIVYVPTLSNLFEVKHIDHFDWLYIITTSVILWFAYKFIQKILDSITPGSLPNGQKILYS